MRVSKNKDVDEVDRVENKINQEESEVRVIPHFGR